MLVLNSEQIRSLVSMPHLIECLKSAFGAAYTAPARQVLSLPGGEGTRVLLCMPAFEPSGGGAIKVSTVFPDNPAKGLPAVQGAIVVFSETGAPIALLDSAVVTRLRTGAASALASTFLSRHDSVHLVIIGTGPLAPHMAVAHCAVRPISRISVCGRRAERAVATMEAIRSLVGPEIQVHISDSTEAAIVTADIVCCATSSAAPVLAGKWLKPGTFVDLVGGFSPLKREADDDVMLRSRIFVDTFEGALNEAGDIIDPLKRGIIDRPRIEGELADLVCGRSRGRVDADEIIVFKSVGTAIEDLATTRVILAAASQG
jgi:alanine dehydrogenase